jgi:nitrous oxidase accessory protein
MRYLILLSIGVFLNASILQKTIDSAKSGSKLTLQSGIYKGNIVINKPLIIEGDNQKAVIEGDGKGTVITIKSDFVTLKNLTIRGSGSEHERVDAGIKLFKTKHCKIINNKIVDVLFGIDIQEANDNNISYNYITSKPYDIGLRGDAIRLWYSNYNTLSHNHITRSRDFVVWYSHENVIAYNYGELGRYSLHFMYTGKNIVKNNTFVKNSVGIFFMYSKDTVATQNTIKSSIGTTGLGIGMKDCSNYTITDNKILYCARGLYIDRSPFEPGSTNMIKNNYILYNSEGVHFHSLSLNNIFKNNIFKGNIEDVTNDSYNTKVTQNRWDGNYWDRYEGFDRDHDGIGDTPFDEFFYADKMWLLNPNIKFFYASPVISAINFFTKLAPISEPVKLLTDNHPKMVEGRM